MNFFSVNSQLSVATRNVKNTTLHNIPSLNFSNYKNNVRESLKSYWYLGVTVAIVLGARDVVPVVCSMVLFSPVVQLHSYVSL